MNMNKKPSETDDGIFDFTITDKEIRKSTENKPGFEYNDSEYIYSCILEKLPKRPFGDYLKRYLDRKSKIKDKNDINEYKQIIVRSFHKNNASRSFDANISMNQATAGNWLNQQSVVRQTVFLLGFGLQMDVEDISNEFLLKVLQECDFNFRNPFEIIYWYCFKNKFNFAKMMELKEKFENQPYNINHDVYPDDTISIQNRFQTVRSDEELINNLAPYKIEGKMSSYSRTSFANFKNLYLKVRTIIAEDYNKDEEAALEKQIQEYKNKNQVLLKSDNYKGHLENMQTLKKWIADEIELTESEIKNLYSAVKIKNKKWIADDITDSDIQKVLYASIRTDEYGNLLKTSESTLSKHFGSKRLSKNHIGKILKEKTVDRYDLITLNFFVFSKDKKYDGEKYDENNKLRQDEFIASTNQILTNCSMGKLYDANPYENFLLMCLMTAAPLSTYNDVLEKSF